MKLVKIKRKDGAESVVRKFNSELHNMLVELSAMTFAGNPDSTVSYAKMSGQEASKTYDELIKFEKKLAEVQKYAVKAKNAVGSVEY